MRVKPVPFDQWNGCKDVLLAVPDYTPIEYTIVRELTITHGHNDSGYFQMDVIFQFSKAYEAAPLVKLTCSDVSGLEIRETHQISGLEFIDAKDRGLETRYELYDYEGGAIKLYCKNFKVEPVKKSLNQDG